ncbi:MAG: hypothetical protein JWQ42_4320 [Edaphobacter sp.]|nr:hypothetical protein [Edaphobacter sp.]
MLSSPESEIRVCGLEAFLQVRRSDFKASGIVYCCAG